MQITPHSHAVRPLAVRHLSTEIELTSSEECYAARHASSTNINAKQDSSTATMGVQCSVYILYMYVLHMYLCIYMYVYTYI